MITTCCDNLTDVTQILKQQKGSSVTSCPRIAISFRLEAELRPCGNPQRMVRAVVEIHFVAGFQSDSEPANEPFDSTGRIEHAIRVTVRDSVEGSAHRIAVGEIQKSALQRNEWTEGAMGKVELRSE